MDPKRLWAKSKPQHKGEHPSMFLLQHLKDVRAAADRILDATGDDQLRALGLDPAEYRDRLRRCVLLAAAVHDLGKANDHFQGMLLGKRKDVPQGIRHEWVTILMLKAIRDGLLTGIDETDFAIVEWAVAGHHPSPTHASPPKSGHPGSGAEVDLQTGHKEFAEILNWLGAS